MTPIWNPTDLQKENLIDLIEALESNEYKQIFGEYYNSTDEKEIQCCAIGLAMMTAKVPEKEYWYSVKSFMRLPIVDIQEAYGIDINDESAIMNWNDTDRLSFPEIAQKLRVKYSIFPDRYLSE